jgi:tellurite resistance protein
VRRNLQEHGMSDTTPRDPAALEIARYAFLVALANDGTLDAGELEVMKQLALRDGVVDGFERQVLSDIFARVNADTVSAEVWQEIQDFKRRFGIR